MQLNVSRNTLTLFKTANKKNACNSSINNTPLTKWWVSNFVPRKCKIRISKQFYGSVIQHLKFAYDRDFDPPTHCVGGDIDENVRNHTDA